MSRVRTCQHLRTSGELCQSPALRHNTLCYFHYRLAQREQRRIKLGGPGAPNTGIELPLLEDAESIQVAIIEVAKAIIDQRIDEKRAGLLLYSFQLALQNLRNLSPLSSVSHSPYVLDARKPLWEGALEEPVDPESKPFRVSPDSEETIANRVPIIYCDEDCPACEAGHCGERTCDRDDDCEDCDNSDCLDRKPLDPNPATPQLPLTTINIQAQAAEPGCPVLIAAKGVLPPALGVEPRAFPRFDLFARRQLRLARNIARDALGFHPATSLNTV